MREWFELLQRLIRDPSQNPAAVGIGVGVVVVFVVILVLVLVAFALPSAPRQSVSTTAASASDRRRLSPRVLLLIAVAGTSILAAGSVALWYHQTSSSEYCGGTCHAMAEASTAWEASAHRDIDCIRCHEGRKWSSFPTGVTNRLDCLYAQYSGKPSSTRVVTAASCIACHTSMTRRTVIGRDGNEFLHDSAYASGRSCTGCHEAQGHVPDIR